MSPLLLALTIATPVVIIGFVLLFRRFVRQQEARVALHSMQLGQLCEDVRDEQQAAVARQAQIGGTLEHLQHQVDGLADMRASGDTLPGYQVVPEGFRHAEARIVALQRLVHSRSAPSARRPRPRDEQDDLRLLRTLSAARTPALAPPRPRLRIVVPVKRNGHGKQQAVLDQLFED